MRLRAIILCCTGLTSIATFAGTAGALQTSTPVSAGAQASAATSGMQATSAGSSNEACSCAATYSDGTSEMVDSCSRNECPDLEHYLECQNLTGNMIPIEGCRLLETCDCHCWETEPRVGHDYGEDVRLSGVTNLWQFDYGCGAFGENAVGCGPVSAAMVLYYWAQRGYDGLTSGFLSGRGSAPSLQEHDWMALVKTLRDDYLDGGICIAGQYATTQTKLRDGIAAFIEDSGYAADVEQRKVCLDCKRNASDEIDATAGLTFIKNELYAGRPPIIGFNVGQATESTTLLFDQEGTAYAAFSGELSNGNAGWIDHYAVVTGYRRIGGEDVIFLNVGWAPDDDGDAWVDIPFIWQPGGKWLHLYGIDIQSPTDGRDWCVLDRGVAATYLSDKKLDASFAFVDDDGDGLSDAPLSVLAGETCGIFRELREFEYTVSWDDGFECDPTGQLDNDIEASLEELPLHGSSSGGTDHGAPPLSGGAPIIDRIPPPGL